MLAKSAIRLSHNVQIDPAKYCAAVLSILRLWRQRRRERDELARMTELELKDLGLVPADRRSLLNAPFWKCYPFSGDAGSARKS
jgi:uncharacterized protein YjiS (DUF1127 family)